MPVNERSRLVSNDQEERYGGVEHVSRKTAEGKVVPTPLEMGQVVVLTLARISEPAS